MKKKLIATFIKPKLRSANVSKESSLVKRRSFLTSYLELSQKKQAFVYIDESSFSTNDITGRTWIKTQSDKVVKFNPQNIKLNVFCAISTNFGVFVRVYDKNGCQQLFSSFLKDLKGTYFLDKASSSTKCTGPTLIMDNSSIHKGQLVEEVASSFGASLLFLPPYTPEFNAVELVFARLKKKTRETFIQSS